MKTYLTKIKQDSRVHVIPYACITKAEASQKLSDMEGLSAWGFMPSVMTALVWQQRI